MADRYLRATGDWNGPVWAATSGGAAGSAATPTTNDNVFIAANYTVTLTGDSVCNNFSQTNGRLNLNGHKLTVYGLGGFSSTGSTARTLDLEGGILELLYPSMYYSGGFSLTGSNLTFYSTDSLIILNYRYDDAPNEVFDTLHKTFTDVVINLGQETSNSITLNITGYPAFRSLIIQSKNSAAHTVNLDDGTSILVDKFIAIGSSTANKLTIKSETGETPAIIGEKIYGTGSSYGQSVAMQDVLPNFSKPYIGSNSTQTLSGWLLQDPPKIATLTDDFPGSSLGADWYDWSGGNLSVSDNKVTINTGTAAETYRGFNTAASHWDATDSSSSIKIEFGSPNADIGAVFMWEHTPDKQVYLEISDGYAMLFTNYLSNWTWHGEIAHSDSYYYRLRESGGTVYAEYSTNGRTWNPIANTTPAFPLYSVKVQIYTSTSAPVSARNISFSKFNIEPELTLRGIKVYDGADWAEKPVKVWTGADWEEKPVKYWDGSDWV